MRQPDFGVIVIGGLGLRLAQTQLRDSIWELQSPVPQTKADKWGLKQRSHMMKVVCAGIQQGEYMH
jgi:hypothetical protein